MKLDRAFREIHFVSDFFVTHSLEKMIQHFPFPFGQSSHRISRASIDHYGDGHPDN